MQSDFQSPMNPLPPVVLILAAAIVLPELIFQVGASGLAGGAEGIGWRIWAIEQFGFFGNVLAHQLQTGDWAQADSARLLTYPFVHSNLTHAAFTAVFVLALGNFTGKVLSGMALVVLFFACSAMGALVPGLILGPGFFVYGAYPAAYGFIGAYTFLMWHGLSRAGENQWRAFGLIGFLLGIQLIFGLLFGGDNTWVADVTGFVTGLVMAPLLAPGGLQALLSRLRR